jgi:hypothetical protein
MKHPTKAPGGWTLEYVVYPGNPGDIAIAVLYKKIDVGRGKFRRKILKRMLAMRWCQRDGKYGTWQEGAHDWFVVPFTFGAAITRSMVEMKANGFQAFDEAGLKNLIRLMTKTDEGAAIGALCY